MRAVGGCLAVGAVTAAFNAVAADMGWASLRGKMLTQTFANQNFGDGVHSSKEKAGQSAGFFVIAVSRLFHASNRSQANRGAQVVQRYDARAVQGGDFVDVELQALDVVVQVDAVGVGGGR